MVAALELHAIATNSSMRLIDSLAEGLVVCIFAALLLRLSRRKNAGTRFAIGFSALLVIALLPITRALLPSTHASATTPAMVVPESWAIYVFLGWAAIAAFLLARVGRSVWHLCKLRKTCVPLDLASVDPMLAETLRRKQTWRKVRLCTSEQVRVPTAIGLVNPAIVIPQWVMQDLSATELNQVALHELAHIRRWDDWTNLAQQIVKALFFFHPAVWWIEGKIALEREMACDDAVLEDTASPRAYAECLAHLAESSLVQRSVAMAQALVGRVTQISQRVTQILDVSRPKANSRTWKPAISLMAGVGVLCSVWAAKTPELVRFDNGKHGAVEFASSVPDRVSVPVTNARFIQRSTPAWTGPKAIPAKRNGRRVQRNLNVPATRAAMRFQKPVRSPVHLSALKSGTVQISETLFLVIESGDFGSADAQICRIQMWHLTVLPLAEAVGSKTHSKKT